MFSLSFSSICFHPILHITKLFAFFNENQFCIGCVQEGFFRPTRLGLSLFSQCRRKKTGLHFDDMLSLLFRANDIHKVGNYRLIFQKLFNFTACAWDFVLTEKKNFSSTKVISCVWDSGHAFYIGAISSRVLYYIWKVFILDHRHGCQIEIFLPHFNSALVLWGMTNNLTWSGVTNHPWRCSKQFVT